jgi:hypothetical protein
MDGTGLGPCPTVGFGIAVLNREVMLLKSKFIYTKWNLNGFRQGCGTCHNVNAMLCTNTIIILQIFTF